MNTDHALADAITEEARALLGALLETRERTPVQADQCKRFWDRVLTLVDMAPDTAIDLARRAIERDLHHHPAAAMVAAKVLMKLHPILKAKGLVPYQRPVPPEDRGRRQPRNGPRKEDTVTLPRRVLENLVAVARECAEHHDADKLRRDPETAGYVESRLLAQVETVEAALLGE